MSCSTGGCGGRFSIVRSVLQAGIADVAQAIGWRMAGRFSTTLLCVFPRCKRLWRETLTGASQAVMKLDGAQARLYLEGMHSTLAGQWDQIDYLRSGRQSLRIRRAHVAADWTSTTISSGAEFVPLRSEHSLARVRVGIPARAICWAPLRGARTGSLQ